MPLSFLSNRGVRLAAAGALGAAMLLGLGTPANAAAPTAPAVTNEAGAKQPALRVLTAEDGTRVAVADDKAVDALTAAAAAANRNCNSACDGTEPTHVWSGGYTCGDDAITVYGLLRPAPQSGYRIELRYSPACRSAWTRGDKSWNFEVESFSGSKSRKSAYYWIPLHTNPTGQTWTAMVNDKGYVARSCYDPTGVSPAAEWRCTSKY